MSAAADPNLTDESTPVALDDVDREVARRLHAIQQPGEQPVLRAHLSNLIIFCKADERACQLEAEVPAIVAVHPARVLLLVSQPGPGNQLTAMVRVRAHPSGDQHRISSEQVTLRAEGPAVQRLPFAVRGLVLGELPINVWWAVPEPPPLSGALLYDLVENAQQIIYDSIGWPDPVRGVVAAANWLNQMTQNHSRQRWRVISDLNWRRLKDWRRILAQSLDPAMVAGALASITEVRITHGPHAVVQAWELASWLAVRLGWQVQTGRVQPGVEMVWHLATPQHPVEVRLRRLAEGPSNIRAIRIACTWNGKPGALNLTLEDEKRIAVMPEVAGAAARTLTLSPNPLAELLGRQLSNRDGDPAFMQSMALARQLGQSLLGA
jgi:glucose-6-phosphate dehydrogenase assembly protein OpcA